MLQHKRERAGDIALDPLPYVARAGEVLAETLDLDRTLHRLLDLVVPTLADVCSIHMLDEDGRFQRVAARHETLRAEELDTYLSGYLLDGGEQHGPIHDVLASGETVMSSSLAPATLEPIFGPVAHTPGMLALGMTSGMLVPLIARGRPFGIMALATTTRPTFGPAHVQLAEDLGRRAALAIDSARLFRAAERARMRTAFLAEAGSALASSLDATTTLGTVVRLAVPLLSESCSVFLVEREGVVRRVAAAHVEPVYQRLLDTSPRLVTLTDHPAHPIAVVLRTGQPYVDHDITDETHSLYADGDYLAFLRQFAMQARVVVPLEARDQRIGALALTTFDPDRRFDEDDVALCVELAGRAALALDNARLYREAADREQALHRLVYQLMTAQEDERRRLAHEIHDGFAQMASGVQQLLEAYAFDFPAESEAAGHRMDVSIGLARRTVAEIRQVLAGLRPTVLDDFGLERGLRAHAEGLADERFRVEVASTLGPDRFAPEVEIALFRLAQEALTNVRKHAGVSSACLRLSRTADEIVLEVEDHGAGFDRTSIEARTRPGAHLGLLGMRERIAQVGGVVEIKSRSGAGTLVRATVPQAGRACRARRESGGAVEGES